jgi:hypothetical protein
MGHSVKLIGSGRQQAMERVPPRPRGRSAELVLAHPWSDAFSTTAVKRHGGLLLALSLALAACDPPPSDVEQASDQYDGKTESLVSARGALLVVGSTTTPSAGDVATQKRLTADGFSVSLVSHSLSIADAQTAASGKALVVISESVTDTKVATNYKAAPVPVMVLEPLLFDDMAFTASASSNFSPPATGQAKVAIINGGHLMAAGLTGTMAVTSSTHNFGWGKPASSADKVATISGNSSEIAIFGFRSGVAMSGGFVAPARRVGWFASVGAMGDLTTAGGKLFDAAVAWVTQPCALGSPDPACAGTTTVPLTFASNDYHGPICVQDRACSIDGDTTYYLPQGSYDIRTPYATIDGSESVGTLTVMPNGALSPDAALAAHFKLIGTSLSAITKTVTLKPQGYKGDIGINGIGHFSGTTTTKTFTLMVGRRYGLGIDFSAGLDRGEGALQEALEVDPTGTNVIVRAEAIPCFDTSGLTLTARVATASFNFNGAVGDIYITALADLTSTANTVTLIQGRRYGAALAYAYNLNNLTWSLGDNAYPLRVDVSGNAWLDGGDASFVKAGNTAFTARVVPVDVTRNTFTDEICFGRIECSLPNEAMKTMHLIAGRRYEVPGGYASTPTGTLVTVPAQGSCSPTMVPMGSTTVSVACNVEFCAGEKDGFACSDGNPCTQTDICQSGVCVGINPLTCEALDDCHTSGTCDPSTGGCSVVQVADGTSCAGGSGTCNGGACTLASPAGCTGAPTDCLAADECHVDGTCSAAGKCVIPNAPDGTLCKKGTGTCNAGACVSKHTQLGYGGGPVLSPEINILFWGTKIDAGEQADVVDYVKNLIKLINGGPDVPPGTEPTVAYYGAAGATLGTVWFDDGPTPTKLDNAGVQAAIVRNQNLHHLPPLAPHRLFIVVQRGTPVYDDGSGGIVTLAGCAASPRTNCSWDGYHDAVGGNFYFSLIPLDVYDAMFSNPVSALNERNLTISHEIFEAMTDPNIGKGWSSSSEEGADGCDAGRFQDKTFNTFGRVSAFSYNPTNACVLFAPEQHAPIAGVPESATSIEIFVRASNGNLTAAHWTPSATGWGPGAHRLVDEPSAGSLLFTPLGAPDDPKGIIALGKPAAAKTPFGNMVWTRGSDLGLYFHNGTGWFPLGGTFYGDPTVVVANGGITAMVRGVDDGIFSAAVTTGTTAPTNVGWKWSKINANFRAMMSPVAIARSSGIIDVFAVGQNGHLFSAIFNKTWSAGFQDLGTLFGGPHHTPTGVTSPDVSTLDIFTTSELGVAHRRCSNQVCSVDKFPSDYDTRPVLSSRRPQGTPAAASWPSGFLHAVEIDQTGSIRYTAWDAVKKQWTGDPRFPLVTGGEFGDGSGDAVLVTRGEGLLDLFYRGSDGGLWTMTFINGTFSDPLELSSPNLIP